MGPEPAPGGWPGMNGLTWIVPKSPLKPAYPPGSSGSASGPPFAQIPPGALDCSEQCTAMPSRSVTARLRPCEPAGCAAEYVPSAASGEPAPNTCVTSLVVFSSSRSAAPTPPKSQPARVNATHGAGVFFWPAVTSVGSGSRLASVGSVQYLNAELKPTPLAASLSKNS